MQTSIVFPTEKDRPDVRDSFSIRPFSTFNSNTARQREIWAVVAVGRAGEIGFNGDMPWHIPEDLRHFKQITMGRPVIMGRKTWLSIPRRPLPGRRNIVLSRDTLFNPSGAERIDSIEEAVALCPPPEIPVIIGGASIYRQALPIITKIFVTRIDADYPHADSFFPEINPDMWIRTDASDTMISASGLPFRFETYESRNNQ